MNENNKYESLRLSSSECAKALLESGYPATKENIATLKKGLADGTYVLVEGKKFRKFIKGAKNVIKTAAGAAGGGAIGLIAGGIPGMAIGAASGAGLGAADAAIDNHLSKDDDDDLAESTDCSDFDLLDILEASDIEPSPKNLDKTKQDLENEKIISTPDLPRFRVQDEPKEPKETKEQKKPVPVIPKKHNYEIPKKSHTDAFLKDYLVNDCDISLKEASDMSAETKSMTMTEIAKTAIKSLSDKMTQLDTSSADRSRGDIKNLKFLDDLQGAITQLEAILERADEYNPNAKKYVGVVIKSILYLNQYSSVFKEAYRNKKTLLILKYESLIMSIISATSYLISQIVDFKSQTLGMKSIVVIEEIAPLKTLDQFNKSVESGEFKIISNDIGTLREFYKELPVESMSTLYEAGDILNMVANGLKSIYDGIDKNKLTQLLYNATGVVVLLLSVRDAIYTLYRTKTKASDMIANIHNFANINLSGGLKSLASFANKFIPDIENASDIAKNEVSNDNRKLATQLRAIKAAPVLDNPVPETSTSGTTQSETQPDIAGSQQPIQSQNNLFDF